MKKAAKWDEFSLTGTSWLVTYKGGYKMLHCNIRILTQFVDDFHHYHFGFIFPVEIESNPL